MKKTKKGPFYEIPCVVVWWMPVQAHATCYKLLPSECSFGCLRDILLPPYCIAVPRIDVPQEMLFRFPRKPGTHDMHWICHSILYRYWLCWTTKWCWRCELVCLIWKVMNWIWWIFLERCEWQKVRKKRLIFCAWQSRLLSEFRIFYLVCLLTASAIPVDNKK